MNIQRIKFVALSDIFANKSLADKAWCSQNHNNFTWGDCNHSLINKMTMIDSLYFNTDTDVADGTTAELQDVLNRVLSLDNDCFIDLEN